MNKTQAVEKLAATRYDGDREAAAKALDSVLDLMIRTTINGEAFRITGFGTLDTEWMAPRWRRNPQTGVRNECPSWIRITWSPGQGFKDLANGDKEIADYPAFINQKAPKGSLQNNQEDEDQ